MRNKKQTAIQELILEFQELKKTKLYETSFKAIDDCIDLAYAKLELEKQQIIDPVNSQRQLVWYEKGERMYSEEEVRKISLDFFYYWWSTTRTNTEENFDKWFEKFKNK